MREWQKMLTAEWNQRLIARPIPPHDTKTYVDVGCGNGSLTKYIGESLGATRVVGVDVKQWSEFEFSHEERGQNCEFIEMVPGGPISLPDACADIVSVLQVLHHVDPTHINKLMTEVVRILKPNGFLLLREHDATNESEVTLLHLQHLLHSCVVENMSVERFYQTYFSQFQSLSYWNELMIHYGFQLVASTPQASIANSIARCVDFVYYRPYNHVDSGSTVS